MAEMTTPIDFMHQLMYKLSHTYQDNQNKLNLALADLTDISGLTQITDWTQLRDIPKKLQEKWAKYRQELRDLTNQPDFPLNVMWPKKPD